MLYPYGITISELTAADPLSGLELFPCVQNSETKRTQISSRTMLLNGNIEYYLDPAGNDSNDGSSGNPWLTFRHAYDYICQNIDFTKHDSAGVLQPGVVTVNVADGTYNENIVLKGKLVGSFHGFGNQTSGSGDLGGILFLGSDPANVTIVGSLKTIDAGPVTFRNCTIQESGGNAYVVWAENESILEFDTCNLDTTESAIPYLEALTRSLIRSYGVMSITGAGQTFLTFALADSQSFIYVEEVRIPSALDFLPFISGVRQSYVRVYVNQGASPGFAGCTGVRWQVTSLSQLDGATTPNSDWPGNVNGSASTGGQSKVN